MELPGFIQTTELLLGEAPLDFNAHLFSQIRFVTVDFTLIFHIAFSALMLNPPGSHKHFTCKEDVIWDTRRVHTIILHPTSGMRGNVPVLLLYLLF